MSLPFSRKGWEKNLFELAVQLVNKQTNKQTKKPKQQQKNFLEAYSVWSDLSLGKELTLECRWLTG